MVCSCAIRCPFNDSSIGVDRMSTMYERYEIYVSCMKDSGEYVKTFQEWLDS